MGCGLVGPWTIWAAGQGRNVCSSSHFCPTSAGNGEGDVAPCIRVEAAGLGWMRRQPNVFWAVGYARWSGASAKELREMGNSVYRVATMLFCSIFIFKDWAILHLGRRWEALKSDVIVFSQWNDIVKYLGVITLQYPGSFQDAARGVITIIEITHSRTCEYLRLMLSIS
jgi:hypothetical protein